MQAIVSTDDDQLETSKDNNNYFFVTVPILHTPCMHYCLVKVKLGRWKFGYPGLNHRNSRDQIAQGPVLIN